MGIEPRSQDYQSDALPDGLQSFLLSVQTVSSSTCYYCQIELVESIWEKEVELRETSNNFELRLTFDYDLK